MVNPHDKILNIPHNPNYDKHYHVDIPLKAKIKHNICMIERVGDHLQLVGEIIRRRHIQVVFYNTGDYFFFGLGYLVVAH